jgi:hypothetical protein
MIRRGGRRQSLEGRAMKKVYISSTYKDLVEYRKAASTALRKIRYDVIRMEESVARDQRTRAACEADVADRVQMASEIAVQALEESET